MRNDYTIRPRAKLKKGGMAKKADMLTAKMSKDKKGRAMKKGKR